MLIWGSCIDPSVLFALVSLQFIASSASERKDNVEESASGFNQSDLLAPPEVLVGDTTSDSVSLSWKAPPVPAQSQMKLFKYTLVVSPVSIRSIGQEKEFSLPPSIRHKQVGGLKEGTKYVIQLSAVYGDSTLRLSHENLNVVSAPKFTVQLPTTLQQDVPVIGDDGIPIGEPVCNCSEVGTVACTRRPGFMKCTCEPGYTGTWCEECAPGNFRHGKECKVCPCSNLTSTALCTIDSSNRVRCAECLPGHRGNLCSSCAAGYHWMEDRCTPLDCLSSSLCMEQRNAPGCEGCMFLEDHFPSPAQRSNANRGIADGTLPLIAVVVTLGILLLVAAMATCYRYWTYRRHQPRIPFWSIELQDEKSDLHAHCHYQHLDAATNRVVSDLPPEAALANGALKNEGGRLNTEQIPKTYNAINV